MESRKLHAGAAGWLLLTGLGVGYVISGDFAGWNFGLAEGGWGGLVVAAGLMGLMYTAIVFSLAELASAIPVAGGGYGFARRALGTWGGFLTGTAILIEYAIAPAAIATFIGAYVESLTGFGGWPVYLACYVVFVCIHMFGVGEALKLIFVIMLVAVIALVIFVVAMIPKFDPSNLSDIAPGNAAGASSFLPFGYLGIWAALPYAMWFFLAVEGVPLAAEETKNPARDLPRGIVGALTILAIFAALILVFAPGGGGANELRDAGDPLLTAIESPAAYGGENVVYWIVNIAGLAGLVASFFAIVFAYSRQTFALSRAGYLPKFLSLTNRGGAPYLALIVPGAIGFVLSLTGKGASLILVAVFGATVSYVLMMVSHIVLRLREPDLPRPFRTPGGITTSSVALVLAVCAAVATFLVEPVVLAGVAGVYAVLIAYFALYSRRRLVATAPEEEFAALEAAEAELGRAGAGTAATPETAEDT